MKKTNIFAASLFIAALVVGAGLGAYNGASAQSTSTTPAPVVCSLGNNSSFPINTTVTLTASGGTGSYVWSSPAVTITNPTGATFSVRFPSSGTYPITVSSGGSSSTCNVIVTSGPMVEAPDPGAVAGTGATTPTTPGLPNTGELPL